MADNVAITAGAGTTIAADEVIDGTLGTVKVQFIKLMDGTLDSSNKLSISAGGAASVAVASALPAGANTIGAVTQASGPWAVSQSGNGAVLSGQAAVTATAAALASNACKSVTVKALIGNTINVYVGPSGVTTANGFELAPGDSITVPASNTNLIFLIASTTGASVSWIATN